MQGKLWDIVDARLKKLKEEIMNEILDEQMKHLKSEHQIVCKCHSVQPKQQDVGSD